MTSDDIREKIKDVIEQYSITKVTLFGSRAEGTNREDSDVDLIVEFSCGASLLKLSMLKCDLEEILGLEVDVIHGPMEPGDLIEVGKMVELYAA